MNNNNVMIMEKESLWKFNKKENYNCLDENLECDILIIGGGISGILTSFYLDNSNNKIVLVERNSLLNGITSKMTAKVTILQDILKKISDKDRDLYIKSQLEGMKLLKENIEKYNLECDFLKNESYLYTTKKSNVSKLKKIEKDLKDNNLKIQNKKLDLNELKIEYSINTDNSYEINPIKYLEEILKLIKNTLIYENTTIDVVLKENKCYVAKTNKGKEIKTKKIVFATNYPYFLKPLLFPLKVHLEKSYIGYGRSNLKGENNFNAINIDKNVHSIRFYKNKMIYLTGSHSLANKVSDYKNFFKVKESSFLENIDNLWSNMDIITNDSLPIVGEILKNMYILTGYNTWGILSSHIGAKIISSMILRKKKYLKYRELFNPKKKMSFKKFLNSSLNVYESINGYIKGIITKNKSIFYSKENAMYVENTGKCYIVKRKCPHLKCNLLFNSVEHTWDCPCHGSRFDLYGNVISGPSRYDIKIKNVK